MNSVRYIGFLLAALALIAYVGLVALGVIGWRDAGSGGPFLTVIHILLFAGLAPLLVALRFWIPARTWATLLIGMGLAAAFVVAHAVIAAYVAHESRDQGTGLMLIEVLAAVLVIALWRVRPGVRPSAST